MRPESFRFSLGDFACYALRDGFFNYPPELFFANAPAEALAAELAQRGLPTERIGTPYTLLLVDTGAQRVLVDTGSGNAGASAAINFPGVDHVDTRTGLLLESLALAGFSPDDVDTVVITHAHPDHVGGTLDDVGRLVFPNARYLLAEAEWAFWQSAAAGRAPHAMVATARRNLRAMERRLAFVADGDEVAPGVRVLDASGHTPGHLNVLVTSQGEGLLHLADTALHPLHLERPDWSPALDLDPAAAAATRKRLLGWAAEKGALLFAHHFGPFPALGRATEREGGWEWAPERAGG